MAEHVVYDAKKKFNTVVDLVRHWQKIRVRDLLFFFIFLCLKLKILIKVFYQNC